MEREGKVDKVTTMTIKILERQIWAKDSFRKTHCVVCDIMLLCNPLQENV